MKPLTGRATAAGTSGFSERLGLPTPAIGNGAIPGDVSGGRSDPGNDSPAFRTLGDLRISSVGFGMAAGDPTDEVDARYRRAVAAALAGGCNHFDVAPSYRGQRSEIALGQALSVRIATGAVQREEVIVATKAGFIPYDSSTADAAHYVYDHFIAPGIAEPDDLAGGIHCMAPNFLGQQIAWSLRNLGLRTIDIFYLQNPETQLPFVDRKTFRRRLQLAFARLEEEVAAGRVTCYGIASWEGLRLSPMAANYMSLEVTQRLVTDVAGANHHLRVVQLPVNGAMLEAQTLRNQPVRNSILPVLSAARDLGFTVVASAALGQGQLSSRMQDGLREMFPTFRTLNQRSLQFVRSLPGVTSAIFGSTDAEHVLEDLKVLGEPPDVAAALRLAHSKGR